MKTRVAGQGVPFYEFDDFRIDPVRRQLRRRDEFVPMTIFSVIVRSSFFQVSRLFPVSTRVPEANILGQKKRAPGALKVGLDRTP